MPGKSKMIYLFVLLSFLCSGQTNFAQTADYWALSMRPDVFEGVSEPKANESVAIRDAIDGSYYNIAASICSFVSGITSIRIVSTGHDRNAKVIVSAVADARVSFRIQLTGIRELARKVEKTNDGYYIARVLMMISTEGRDRAKQYIDRETMAIRAYRYFAPKFNLAPLTLTDVPVGFSDYLSWLESNSFIFQMRASGSDYITHLDIFLRKFNRTIVSFTDKLDNKSALIVYGATDYYQKITSALQKTGFSSYRENSKIWLIPHISPEEFQRRVREMPDAGAIVIAGIGSYDNRFTQISPAALYEIARIAGQRGMEAQVVLRLPDQYQNGIYNDTDIINMLGRNTARYTLLVKSTLIPEPLVSGFIADATSPHFSVFYQIIVLDSLTGKIIFSDSVKDVGSYSVTNVRIVALQGVINNMLDNL
jgi:hypothetical protein